MLGFLLRRTPRFGLAQLMEGIRHRRLGYTAMELAAVLPAQAKVVVDVGAHRGDVTAALDFLFRPTRLISVEPNPLLGDFLRTRFAGKKHIEVVTEALSDREGTAEFQLYGFDAASSLFHCRPGHLTEFGFDESRTSTTVTTTTLAVLLERAGIDQVDLLKLDCQGAELMILQGAGDKLRRVYSIYVEVSFEAIYQGAPLFAEVHGWLITHGFFVAGLFHLSGVNQSVQWADALYIRDDTLIQ